MRKCSLVVSLIVVTVVLLETDMWNICINSNSYLCAVQGWIQNLLDRVLMKCLFTSVVGCWCPLHCIIVFLSSCARGPVFLPLLVVESSWNVMAHGDAQEGKWRGDWQMECVAFTLNPTSELGVSSVTTADAHTLAASSRLNWRPCRFKWNRPFRRKTKI